MYTNDKVMLKQLVSSIAKRMSWVSNYQDQQSSCFLHEEKQQGEQQNL